MKKEYGYLIVGAIIGGVVAFMIAKNKYGSETTSGMISQGEGKPRRSKKLLECIAKCSEITDPNGYAECVKGCHDIWGY